MPTALVNLTQGAWARIQDLVERGLYKAPEQFLEVAAFNQLALEDGMKPHDIVERGLRGAGPKTKPTEKASEVADASVLAAPVRRSRPVKTKAAVAARHTRDVPDSMMKDSSGRLKMTPDLASPPQIFRATPRPATEHLWGQVNRLFPLKVVCRWLIVCNAGSESWKDLPSMSDLISEDAGVLGSALERFDALAGRKREEPIATGLPRRGNRQSLDRFLSQYIARTTRAGDIYPGAVCHYALADFDGDRIALTECGVELARLSNPVLDEDASRAAAALGDDERAFFVRQVLQYVPGELSDLRLVLGLVSSGASAPEDLLKEARRQLPEGWSPVMVRTHISGAIARSADMGLLRRRWEGRFVTYAVTPSASAFLST